MLRIKEEDDSETALKLVSNKIPLMDKINVLLSDHQQNSLQPFLKKNVSLIRDFTHPTLELIRLLKEISEVEHSLMLQYLAAAFSLKPEYQQLKGGTSADSDSLFGVAIEEMQHLSYVNGLLIELGSNCNLDRQDLPYETDIYPFELTLEPVSQYSLAKYVYTEAAPGKTNPNHPDHDDLAFLTKLFVALGDVKKPNHLGSVYHAIIKLMDEVSAFDPSLAKIMSTWKPIMEDIQIQGEEDHYEFFKSLFTGSHTVLNNPDIWEDVESEKYPALSLKWGLTALEGFETTYADEEIRLLAMLSNLHYWLILGLLHASYKHKKRTLLSFSKVHMTGPFLDIGTLLAKRGYSLPYDRLSLNYDFGANERETIKILTWLLVETENLESRLKHILPVSYPFGVSTSTKKTLVEILQKL